MTRIRAEEDILVEKPGQLGAYTILYRKGDYVREEDLERLGLSQKPQAKARVAPPEDKAKRGPREGGKTRKRSAASRDKALNGPKEE